MICLRGWIHLCRKMASQPDPPSLRKLRLKDILPEYGHSDKSKECVVCVSRGMYNVKHRHFSSAYQRIVKITEGAGLLECPICQAEHPIGIMCTTRLKCIFASSTLHNSYQAEAWLGTEGYHVDVETICGAKIKMGKVIWEAPYFDCPMNIDTHIVMGLNDILAMIKSEPSDDDAVIDSCVHTFMERLQDWYNITVNHCTTHKLESANRFSVSPVLMAPQIYSFPGNKKENIQQTHREYQPGYLGLQRDGPSGSG